MQEPTKKSARRGLAAAAVTALVLGSGFMPALAATEASETPSPTPATSQSSAAAAAAGESPSATASPSPSSSVSPSSSPSAHGTLDDASGLTEAIERDLGQTPEEFEADAKVSEEAADIQKKLEDRGIDSTASVEDGKATVTVGEEDKAKAEQLLEDTAEDSAALVAEIGAIHNVKDVYSELVENVKPTELTRLTSIMRTAGGLEIMASGPARTERKVAGSATEPTEGGLTLEQFVKEADGVTLVKGSGPAKTTAENDFLGGMAYAIEQTDNIEVCSAGFNAWAPDGSDAIISAGHCAEDGQGIILGIVEQTAPNTISGLGPELGTFGFSQFGGRNNSGIPLSDLEGLSDEEAEQIQAATTPGTDISVIEDINPELNLPALVSKWSAAGPREGSVKVTGVGRAVLGEPACSSGRTTGWSCSVLWAEGLFFVGGFNNDIRPVWGYAADNPGQSVLDQGDSGGAVLQGSTAIGVNSANAAGPDGKENTEDDIAFYTSLGDVQAKGYLKGYQVKFFVNAPKLNRPKGATVTPSAALTGTVAQASAGTTVQVIVDGKITQRAAVDAEGAFSFKAPAIEGPFAFTLKAVNGFNVSTTTRGSVVVAAPAPSPSPSATPTASASAPSNEPSNSPSSAPSRTEQASPTPQEPRPLADTGATGMPLLATGGTLALAGVVFLLMRRGPRRHG